MPLLEAAALGLGPANVILLQGHRVRDARLADAIERGAEVPRAGGRRVIGVVGEDLEEPSSDNLVPLRHRRFQVRVVRRDDRQVWRKDEEEPRRRLEDGTEVRHAIAVERRHLALRRCDGRPGRAMPADLFAAHCGTACTGSSATLRSWASSGNVEKSATVLMFDPRVRLWVASGERRRGQRNQARHLIYVKECTTRRACVNDSEPPAPNSARAEFRPGRRSQAKAGVGKSQKTVGEITDSDGHDSPRGLGMRGRRIPPLCLDSRPLWERRRRRLRATLQRLTCPTDIRVSFKFQQSVINGLFKALRTPGRHTPRAHHTAGQRGRAGRRRPRGRSGHRRRRTASDASTV